MTTVAIQKWHNKHELTRQEIDYVFKVLKRWGITEAWDVHFVPKYDNLHVNAPKSSVFGSLGCVSIFENGYRLQNTRELDGFHCTMSMDTEEARERDEIKADAPAYHLRSRK